MKSQIVFIEGYNKSFTVSLLKTVENQVVETLETFCENLE